MKLLKENYKYDTNYEEKMTEEEIKEDPDWVSAFTEESIEGFVKECLNPIWRRRGSYWKHRGIDKKKFEILLRSFYRYTLDGFISGDCRRKDGWFWISSDHALEKWGIDYGLEGVETHRFFSHVDAFGTYS